MLKLLQDNTATLIKDHILRVEDQSKTVNTLSIYDLDLGSEVKSGLTVSNDSTDETILQSISSGDNYLYCANLNTNTFYNLVTDSGKVELIYILEFDSITNKATLSDKLYFDVDNGKAKIKGVEYSITLTEDSSNYSDNEKLLLKWTRSDSLIFKEECLLVDSIFINPVTVEDLYLTFPRLKFLNKYGNINYKKMIEVSIDELRIDLYTNGIILDNIRLPESLKRLIILHTSLKILLSGVDIFGNDDLLESSTNLKNMLKDEKLKLINSSNLWIEKNTVDNIKDDTEKIQEGNEFIW